MPSARSRAVGGLLGLDVLETYAVLSGLVSARLHGFRIVVRSLWVAVTDAALPEGIGAATLVSIANRGSRRRRHRNEIVEDQVGMSDGLLLQDSVRELPTSRCAAGTASRAGPDLQPNGPTLRQAVQMNRPPDVSLDGPVAR